MSPISVMRYFSLYPDELTKTFAGLVVGLNGQDDLNFCSCSSSIFCLFAELLAGLTNSSIVESRPNILDLLFNRGLNEYLP